MALVVQIAQQANRNQQCQAGEGDDEQADTLLARHIGGDGTEQRHKREGAYPGEFGITLPLLDVFTLQPDQGTDQQGRSKAPPGV